MLTLSCNSQPAEDSRRLADVREVTFGGILKTVSINRDELLFVSNLYSSRFIWQEHSH